MSEIDEKMKRLEAKGQELKTLSVIARAQTLSRFGKQFDGDRDLYDTLGWEENPSFKTYLDQYKRGGIAKVLIDIRPEETWRGELRVTVPRDEDGVNEKTAEEFEKKFSEIAERVKLKDYLLRSDKLAGVGQYSVLRLGFKESNMPETLEAAQSFMSQPATTAMDLLYVSVFSQKNARIKQVDKDPSSANYGNVGVYELTESNDINQSLTDGTNAGTENVRLGQTISVHHSRCVHIAENLLEDEIYGTPRLEAVLNHLYDLQKVTGGSAEMYWQGALPPISFALDPEAPISEEQLSDMEDEIDAMIMGLKRYMKLQGVDPKQLAPTVVSPDKQVDVYLTQIAGTSRVPKRILMGSERGELASSQDDDQWLKVIQSRRETECNRWIRAIVEKCQAVGILPEVPKYVVEWSSLKEERKKETAETALNIARAIKEFVQGDGQQVLTLEVFLEQCLRLPKDLIDEMLAEMEEAAKEEEANLDEEDELLDADDDDSGGIDDGLEERVAKIVKDTLSGDDDDDDSDD